MGVGGSAAGGKASSQSKLNPNASNGHAKAMANEGEGVWSKSMTHTKDHHGTLSSRTKSMSHEPGGPPAKSTVGASVGTSE
jgi:D-serine deaminase-like pyridoxal phosphate-dependent protein